MGQYRSWREGGSLRWGEILPVQSSLQTSPVQLINKTGPESVRTFIVCSGGTKKRHGSLPYRLHKETSPWRQGLFLETCDTSVSDGVFLKPLLTVFCAQVFICVFNGVTLPPPPTALLRLQSFTTARMQTSGVPLLVFFLEASCLRQEDSASIANRKQAL